MLPIRFCDHNLGKQGVIAARGSPGPGRAAAASAAPQEPTLRDAVRVNRIRPRTRKRGATLRRCSKPAFVPGIAVDAHVAFVRPVRITALSEIPGRGNMGRKCQLGGGKQWRQLTKANVFAGQFMWKYPVNRKPWATVIVVLVVRGLAAL